MKSLIKGNSPKQTPNAVKSGGPTLVVPREEAQCCAKVSKTVAGCHD